MAIISFWVKWLNSQAHLTTVIGRSGRRAIGARSISYESIQNSSNRANNLSGPTLHAANPTISLSAGIVHVIAMVVLRVTAENKIHGEKYDERIELEHNDPWHQIMQRLIAEKKQFYFAQHMILSVTDMCFFLFLFVCVVNML